MKYYFLPFLLFTFLISCSPQKKEKREISQKTKLKEDIFINPIDSILGDKIKEGDSIIIRHQNFDDFYTLPLKHLKEKSKIYTIKQIDENHYSVSQKISYSSARNFTILLKTDSTKITRYYVLNDYIIHDIKRQKNNWILICCDWTNGNTYWRKNYQFKIEKLDLDFNLIWSYSPDNSIYPLDGDKILEITDDKIVCFVHVIPGSHMLYDGAEITIDQRGKCIEAMAEMEYLSKSVLKKIFKIQKPVPPFESYISQIDQLRKQGKLKKYFYPNMSYCGGGLYGYYLHDTLVYIEATYGADVGYSSKKIYWQNDSILKIIYHEHFAEQEKYQEKYPNFETIDFEKMTYTDFTQTIEFDKKIRYKTKHKNKISTTKIDSLTVSRLIECGESMKKELESEKVER